MFRQNGLDIVGWDYVGKNDCEVNGEGGSLLERDDYEHVSENFVCYFRLWKVYSV